MTPSAKKIEVYLDEYTRDDIIARYISRSAGAGIAYLLTNVYSEIYRKVIKSLLPGRRKEDGWRVLEYGCGGGMNLLKIVESLQAEGEQLERGFGTDFSPPMIEAARKEAAAHLPAALVDKLTYAVAGNEALIEGLSEHLHVSKDELLGSFDLIVGVNTTRYAHRLQKQKESAQQIFNLLKPGAFTVMIDMNRHFPFFRSKFKHMFTKPADETYIPSLKEYTRPFREAGFIITESRNFCWIPHSAKPRLLAAAKAMAPLLDACCSPFAMRSLVVAQKPR